MNRRQALKLLSAIPATATVETLHATANDVIVISFPDTISSEIAEQLKRRASQAFPGFRFMVLGNGAKVSVLRQE